jgi:NAD(P)H dehydrogenase (quinone)
MAKVLVLGATGDQGQPLMTELLKRGHHVRAGTRDPSRFPKAEFPAAEVVAADFPEAESLVSAATGMDALVMHLPFTFDLDFARVMGRNIAAAAKAAQVGKIVFHTSCYVAPTDLGIGGHDARRIIEAEIEASGRPFAFIRSAVFMDNMVRVWAKPSIVNHGLFAYPAGQHLKISWVALKDVAAYMVAALENPDVTAHRFMVGGPEALTGDEVAARLSEALGRTIRFHSLHPDDFARGMTKLVTGKDELVPGSIYDRMADFYRWYNRQEVSPLAVDLAPALAMLKVTPTPLLAWAKQQDWSL